MSDELGEPASARGVLFALIILTMVKLVIASILPLAADEAYYWTWAERLSLGYYDHPPGIAYLIELSGSIFGTGELGVRGLGVLLHSAVIWGLVRAFPKANSWLMLLLLAGAPLFMLGGLLATPDSPLLIGWSLAIIGSSRDDWRLVGVAVGVISKMTGLLLMVAVVYVYRQRRSWLLKALILPAIILTPHIYWSLSNGGAPYLFQIDHGLGGGLSTLGLLEGVGGQILLVGPFIMYACFRWFGAGVEKSKGPTYELLFWSAALTFFAFVMSAVKGNSELNWAAPAWLSVFVGISFLSDRRVRAVWVGAWSHGILGGFLIAQALGPLWTFPKGPTDRFYYGDAIGGRAAEWNLPVVASHYQYAALAQFYGGVDATTVPDFWRSDEYDLSRTELPDEALVILPMNEEEALISAGQWYALEELESIKAWRGQRHVGEWALYRGALLEERVREINSLDSVDTTAGGQE